ncbi:hypothetical protein [Desmospora activa]|uniref:Uncharacterized protein n=1 Tax=Desmospora activa DSM 45169 TaxID=1121389 RepID=A0A2T4Z6H9_9BACL|nr:hypothetical protein [Desmospora activa]PTM57497.1 hypothetical protein C8J48_0045 [Desmospora activa DSM 45169]
MVFYLKQGDTILGTLHPNNNGDFPWMHCEFKPTASFEQVKPLFDELCHLSEQEEDNQAVLERLEECWAIIDKQIHVISEDRERWSIGLICDDFASIRP